MLDDAAIRQFVVQGFTLIPPASTPQTHDAVAADVLDHGLHTSTPGGQRTPYGLATLGGDAAGNNLLHAAPLLRGEALLQHPRLVAMLSALLGPSYRLHPHCRSHLRLRGAATSMWHCDARKGVPWSSGRQHEPHWLIVCYYPQRVTLEMGPTELLPATQYLAGDSDKATYSRGHIPAFNEQLERWDTARHALVCEAGSVLVMHYDLWHRALATDSDTPRMMLKFVATRSALPACAPHEPPPEWRRVDPSDESETALGFLAKDEAERHLADSLRAAASRGLSDEEVVDWGIPAAPQLLTAPLSSLLLHAYESYHSLGSSEATTPWAEVEAYDTAPQTERLLRDAMAEAKCLLERDAAPLDTLPRIKKWLKPRCTAIARGAARARARRRLVRDFEPIWRYVWSWLHGAASGHEAEGGGDSGDGTGVRNPLSVDAAAAASIAELLGSSAEPSRLRIAYALARTPGGERLLQRALGDERMSVARTAMYGLVAAGTSLETLLSSDGDDDGCTSALALVAAAAAGSPLMRAEPVKVSARTGSVGRQWVSASIVRERDGFDAELLLASANVHAQATHLAVLACVRAAPRASTSLADTLVRLLRDAASGLPIATRHVCLEALGVHAGHATCPQRAVAVLAGVLADDESDGADRAVSAFSLAQLAAQALEGGSCDLRAGLLDVAECVVAAHESDPDRYVRGYCFDFIATLCVASAPRRGDTDGQVTDDLEAVVAAVATKGRLGEARRWSRGGTPPDGCASVPMNASAAQAAARWLISFRRCPLTCANSPY